MSDAMVDALHADQVLGHQEEPGEEDPAVLNVEPSGIPGVLQASEHPVNVPAEFFIHALRNCPSGYTIRVEKGIVYADHPTKPSQICVPTHSVKAQ